MTVLAPPRGRQRTARVVIDATAIGLMAATIAEIADPEILIDALWVTLAVGAFVFSLKAALVRIAAGTAFVVGYMVLSVSGSGMPVDLEDLAVVPLLLTITLIIAFMAHRVSTTATRYATLYRVASERLLTMQEDERTRLSRDLHDSLGQTLTAATLALDVASTDLVSVPPRVSKASVSIQLARTLVETSLDQAREVALRLRPPRIHEEGLGVAIRSLAEAAGIPVEVRFAASAFPPGALDPDQEIGLFRIVQEAVANAARHSHASRAWVDAEVLRERVGITVGDDGVGFDVGAPGRGLGLIGMQERAGILDGRLSIRSSPGAGTTVSVVIPLRSAVHATGLEPAAIPASVTMPRALAAEEMR